MTNCNKDKLCCKNTRFKKTPVTSGALDFPIFLILRYVAAFSVRFLMIGVYFLLFSFILLRSIVVYLKSGSRMTFFVFSFIFFKSIVVYLKLSSRLTFLLSFLCAFLLTFSLAFLLTLNLHLLTRRREEDEGVDLFLKSNDPTPEGGEIDYNP